MLRGITADSERAIDVARRLRRARVRRSLRVVQGGKSE
jgi:hypothetical protein